MRTILKRWSRVFSKHEYLFVRTMRNIGEKAIKVYRCQRCDRSTITEMGKHGESKAVGSMRFCMGTTKREIRKLWKAANKNVNAEVTSVMGKVLRSGSSKSEDSNSLAHVCLNERTKSIMDKVAKNIQRKSEGLIPQSLDKSILPDGTDEVCDVLGCKVAAVGSADGHYFCIKH